MGRKGDTKLFHCSFETSDKLKRLAEHGYRTMTAVIIMLIDKEYERVFGSENKEDQKHK